MKALVLTSDSLRHLYFAKKINDTFSETVFLVEEKKNYYQNQKNNSLLINKHFEKIKLNEKKWFKVNNNICTYFKLVDDINNRNLFNWVKTQRFDVICLFGTSILNETWINEFPNRIINLHLGLSPYYRGSATLFWPFANQELEYLGTTIHLASKKVDAGNIINRNYPNFIPEENYYDITSRLIKDSIDIFPQVVLDFLKKNIKAFPQENIKGKLFKKIDFREINLLDVLKYSDKGFSQSDISKIMKKRKCLS
jgi:folate-dependent phosphoribosylglycinamide formyltransferase PurN